LSESLLRLLTAEYAHRQQQSMLYRLSQAKIPFDWSLESFPFKNNRRSTKTDHRAGRALLYRNRPQYRLDREPGTGKTGLAIGLCESPDRRLPRPLLQCPGPAR